MIFDIPLRNSKGTSHLFFLQKVFLSSVNTHNEIKQFWNMSLKSNNMKWVSPNKKCGCFHNCRDIIIACNFVRPMNDTRFSYRWVAGEHKAAKSESNEGRYFRNFTVIV